MLATDGGNGGVVQIRVSTACKFRYFILLPLAAYDIVRCLYKFVYGKVVVGDFIS